MNICIFSLIYLALTKVTKVPRDSRADFIKVKSWVFFIDIALSIYALTPMPKFCTPKSKTKVDAMFSTVRPTFMKSTPEKKYIYKNKKNIKLGAWLKM